MALPNAVNGGSVTTIPSGAIIVIHAPAATVSGWQDYYMSSVNFLKSVTDDITQIEADIVAIQGDISDLQDLGTLDQTLTGLNTFTDKSFDGNSLIEWVGVKRVTGTATIKMGTNNPDYDNIIPSIALTQSRNIYRVDHDTGAGASESIRITVSGGGSCNFSFKITKNILI